MNPESVSDLVEQGKSRTRGDDRSLAELARRQHGVVARRQLLDRGWTREEIDWRIRKGRLLPIHPGVYAVGHRLVQKQGWWTAAVLASGPGALLSHQTAATLWGLRGYSGRVHVSVPHKSTSNRSIHRHFSPVPADERGTEEGISATSVHRTIFDLAASEPLDVVIAMIKQAEYRNRYDRLSLPDLLERYAGKRGSRKLQLALRRITEEPAGPMHSRLEERFAPFLRRHGLPMPRFNDWIQLERKRYRVDCHWPRPRQIVELDGWDGHSTRSAFRDDRARDRVLRVAGYSVTRLTWSQLDDEPGAIASDLRVLLEDTPAGPRRPLPV